MCNVKSEKKEKKSSGNQLTVHDMLCNEFFLGDIAFTILPIGISLLIQLFSGTISWNFLLITDWPFVSIIISSLALTRMLELKVIYQRDISSNVIALSRASSILIILSTVCFALYTMKQQGNSINSLLLIYFQVLLLTTSIGFLYISHFYREKLKINRERFPIYIEPRDFHMCLLSNLNDAKEYIRYSRIAFNKEYQFIEENYDIDTISVYGKAGLNQLIEDMQRDLTMLKQDLEAWEKPPYISVPKHKAQEAASEQTEQQADMH